MDLIKTEHIEIKEEIEEDPNTEKIKLEEGEIIVEEEEPAVKRRLRLLNNIKNGIIAIQKNCLEILVEYGDQEIGREILEICKRLLDELFKYLIGYRSVKEDVSIVIIRALVVHLREIGEFYLAEYYLWLIDPQGSISRNIKSLIEKTY